ncbi:hypothetical protein [Halothiobacillus sp.]|uniref:hypothetical protein n=1 Tax=Halothiobacillus sp. TaxID=1891311 RepID=UPI002AD4DC74|nr:hypothetical protein [Halothiobacillus sp.]
MTGFDSQVMESSWIDPFSHVGSYCYIGRNCNLTEVTVRNYCAIANNVSIAQGDPDLHKVSTSSIFYPNAYGDLTSSDCIVGNDVWIGTDVVILRGVAGGNGCVVDAGAVVTNDVPDFAVAVGVSAKVIKCRFSSDVAERIKATQWWSLPPGKSSKVIADLHEEIL